MSGMAAAFAFGILVAVGLVVLVRVLRSWAQDRAREARYADEWVRRHRAGRQP